MIVLQDSGGRDVYPGFQLQDGWPHAALIAAYRTVAAAANPWTAASWAASLDPLLDSRTPADFAANGGSELLLRLASRDAARLLAA